MALPPLESPFKHVNPKGLQRYTENPEKKSVPENIIRNAILVFISFLLYNFSYLARAYRTAAFADGKTQPFLHGDLVDKLNFDRHVVARH